MEPRNPGEEDPSQLPRPGLLLSSRAAKSGGGRLVKDTDAPPLSTQPHHVPLYLKPTPAPRNLMPPLLWLLMRPPGLPLPTPPNPHHPTLLLLLRLCPGLCSPFHPQSLGLRALSSFLFSPGWAPTGAD